MFLFCLIQKKVEIIMKDAIKAMQNEYAQKTIFFNKNASLDHRILENNYVDLCIYYYGNQYNITKSKEMAEDSMSVAIESEDLFVDWLNKE
jgi:hypothetical protein